MTITRANRDSIRPPVFTVAFGYDTDVEADNLRLCLRPYDIEVLQALLTRYDILAGSVNVYDRPQGLARRLLWWRDRNSVIGSGLLALCANTAHLDPFERVPNPRSATAAALSPSLPFEEQVRQLVEPARALLGRRPWLKTLAAAVGYLLTDGSEETIPRFPFRERDGSRWEPLEELMRGNYTPQASVWLPLAVRERLTECGANFREQGRDGIRDPLGRFDTLNRSAAVRRLIEGYRKNRQDGRPLSPLHFRGIELYERPVTPEEWKADRAHGLASHIQIAEAAVRRHRNTYDQKNLGAHPLRRSAAIQSVRDRELKALIERAERAKERATKLAQPENLKTVQHETLEDESATVPTGTTAAPQYETPAPTQSAPAEQKTKRQRAPVRKVRKDAITEFNPDELG